MIGNNIKLSISHITTLLLGYSFRVHDIPLQSADRFSFLQLHHQQNVDEARIRFGFLYDNPQKKGQLIFSTYLSIVIAN